MTAKKAENTNFEHVEADNNSGLKIKKRNPKCA
jgi:hypothetical protein